MTSDAGTAVTGRRPPATVWILTALFAALAFFSVVGSLVFAFPLGGALGYTIGTLLLIAGVVYAFIAWHLRRGSRAIWTAALIVPVVHQGGLAIVDMMREGRIPSEDYPFIAGALIIVILLLLPRTRRFYQP